MKSKFMRVLCLALTCLLALSCFAACGNGDDKPSEDGTKSSNTEAATNDEKQMALDAITVKWGGGDFGILAANGYKDEVYAENGQVTTDGGASQVINDAVYERNVLLEDKCDLKFVPIIKDAASCDSAIRTESQAPTGDFTLIEWNMNNTANQALSGTFYNYLALGVDVDQPWWDQGTADFALADNIFFMNGAINFVDDNLTYVLIFNKGMANSHNIPNPYDTVKEWKWTLSYFNELIQGISSENGDGKWNELDTYGFVTTWEYGNTFFLGSDLRYINNSRSADSPSLYLSDHMDKAMNVLDLAKSIYHNNNATYMSPPGQENLGLAAFKGNRGMFYGEVAQYLRVLNADMDGDYGVLPVPKYDESQEFYRTWTHDSGSCLSVISSIPEDKAETVGAIIEAYAILSAQKVQPAYYDIMLTSRNVRDPESAEMLDIIFQNRVYDMAFYFQSTFPNFYNLFKTSVNDNSDSFSSQYTRASNGFDKKVSRLLAKLEK